MYSSDCSLPQTVNYVQTVLFTDTTITKCFTQKTYLQFNTKIIQIQNRSNIQSILNGAAGCNRFGMCILKILDWCVIVYFNTGMMTL